MFILWNIYLMSRRLLVCRSLTPCVLGYHSRPDVVVLLLLLLQPSLCPHSHHSSDMNVSQRWVGLKVHPPLEGVHVMRWIWHCEFGGSRLAWLRPWIKTTCVQHLSHWNSINFVMWFDLIWLRRSLFFPVCHAVPLQIIIGVLDKTFVSCRLYFSTDLPAGTVSFKHVGKLHNFIWQLKTNASSGTAQCSSANNPKVSETLKEKGGKDATMVPINVFLLVHTWKAKNEPMNDYCVHRLNNWGLKMAFNTLIQIRLRACDSNACSIWFISFSNDVFIKFPSDFIQIYLKYIF